MKDIWINSDDRDGPERLIAVEYQDGHPVTVLTEEHWDHSRKPWFKADRDRPNGTCAKWYDFDWCKRDGTLYYHNSGQGGDIRFHVARFVYPVPPKALLWVAPGIPIVMSTGEDYRTITTDAELLTLGYRRIRQPRLLSSWDSKTRNPFEVSQEGHDCGLYVYKDDRSFVDEKWKV